MHFPSLKGNLCIHNPCKSGLFPSPWRNSLSCFQHALFLRRSTGNVSFSLTKSKSMFLKSPSKLLFFLQLVCKSLKYLTLDITNLFHFGFNIFEAACLRLCYLQHCFAFHTEYFQHPLKSLFGFNSIFSQRAMRNSRSKPNGLRAIEKRETSS